jgi:hypothetical protein
LPLLAITSLASLAFAVWAEAAEERTCTMQPTKSVCHLACGSASVSQTCDHAVNQCRSTCGLYGNNGSAIEVLQGLSDALPPSMPLPERLTRSSSPYIQIITYFQRLGGGLTPRSFSILVPKEKPDAFAQDVSSAFERVNESVTSTDGNKAVVQFSLPPASVARIQAGADPKEMLDDARKAILSVFRTRA